MSKLTRLGQVIGVLLNTLTIVSYTGLFVLSISTLWGWWFYGVGSCVMFLAYAIDKRVIFRKVILRRTIYKPGERASVIYAVSLLAIALISNVVFFIAYFLGVGVPYDADPRYLPPASIIYRE